LRNQGKDKKSFTFARQNKIEQACIK